MNFLKSKKLIAVILITLFAVSVSFAQEQQGSGEKKEKEEDVVKNRDGTYSTTRFDEADRPDDSYLQKDHAFDIVPYQQRRNIEYLYRLKIIKDNANQAGWSIENFEDDYQKCYDGYKKAMQYFYKKNYIYARLDFDLNYKDLKELMNKVAECYKSQVIDMLDECVDMILLAHMDEVRRADPEKNAALRKAQNRLRVAYNILDEADTMMIDKYFHPAVIQLRMSKAYCIKIMEDFTKPDKRDEVKEKYKIMKADNLNRIYKVAPEKVPVPQED
jgi:hypothetical protein